MVTPGKSVAPSRRVREPSRRPKDRHLGMIFQAGSLRCGKGGPMGGSGSWEEDPAHGRDVGRREASNREPCAGWIRGEDSPTFRGIRNQFRGSRKLPGLETRNFVLPKSHRL